MPYQNLILIRHGFHPTDTAALVSNLMQFHKHQHTYSNVGEFGTGGGWVVDPTGSHGNFGFNARYDKTGRPKGQMVYVWRSTCENTPADFIVKSTSQNLTMLSFSNTAGNYPNTIFVQGGAMLQAVSEIDGTPLSCGWGNLQFTMGATDSEQSSGIGVDSFALTVSDSKNNVIKAVGTIHLSGGNIVIHIGKGK